jgi:cysteine desulfurase
MTNQPIYMDNNATTAVDPAVLEAMLPFYKESFGNPASVNHSYGAEAAQAVETARNQVAQLIGAEPKEIIWTSGATESDNLAIKGVAEKYCDKGNHIITCTTEHKAVLDTCKYLQQKGFEITCLPVDNMGMIDLRQLRESITGKTILISLMAVNNETGVIHPIEEVGAIAHEKKVFFHCDATQAAGKMPIDVKKMNIDLLSCSAHKIYGPKGVGALYVRSKDRPVKPAAIIHGGGHEHGMRSGTLNAPAIVGMGKACEICRQTMEKESKRLSLLGEKLYKAITEQIEYVTLNGHPDNRLKQVVNIGFAYVEGEFLMLSMPGIAVSSGSACTSATLGPSYVLQAMGISHETANGSLRFSLGRFNTEQQIDEAVKMIARAVHNGRQLSPLYETAMQGQKEKGL